MTSFFEAKAPVRISFGTCGDTDYYTDLIGWGNGVNATIDLYSSCQIHKRNDDKIVLRSLETGHVLSFDSLDGIKFDSRELNMMKSVVKHYGATGVEVITHSDAPLESGLGGSAAHCVAMIRAFDAFKGITRTAEETAKLAYDIERNMLGIEGGYQDQWASAYGGMNYMEFRKEGVTLSPLMLTGRELEFLEKSLLLVFVPREKDGSAIHFEQRKKGQESLPMLMMKRENILRLKDALERRKFSEIGPILQFDWKIKKHLAPGISTSRIDEIYDAALNAGALGGRFIGAGSGGSAIFFCPEKSEAVLRALERLGANRLRYRFERRYLPKNYKEQIRQRIGEHSSLASAVLGDEALMEKVQQVSNKIVECYRNDGKVVVFGNGGSAADAQHIVGELVNKFRIDRPMLNAIALTVNTSVLTAIANDSSYDEVFAKQIEFLVDSRDIVIGISTSGKAVNVMKALRKANERNATVIYLTGADGGMISRECEAEGTIDISIKVPHERTERVQEMHMLLGHIICELVEQELFA